jgi:hypothetical protein
MTGALLPPHAESTAIATTVIRMRQAPLDSLRSLGTMPLDSLRSLREENFDSIMR